MYFNKTVLTLMAISLYLIPRAELAVQTNGETTKVEMQSEVNNSSYQRAELADQSGEASEEEQPSADTSSLDQTQSANEIIEFQEGITDLSVMIDDANKIDQLCVVYYVHNNGNYDEMFEEFASKFPATKFVKVIVNTKSDGEKTTTSEKKLVIRFYKFGEYVGNFSSEEKDIIGAQIQRFANLNRTELANVHKEETQQQSEDPESLDQIRYVDGIYYAADENELNYLCKDVHDKGQNFLIYVFDNSFIFDQIFKDLAITHSNTRFIRIDANYFKYKSGEKLNIDNIPQIVFQKYGIQIEGFTLIDKAKIEERLTYYENLSKEEFQKVAKEERLKKLVQQVQQIKFDNGIYYVQYEKELENLYTYAANKNEYCLTYVINDTDQFDQIFKDLSNTHPKTRFIRLDSTKFTRNSGEKFMIETQPLMVFQRDASITQSFNFTEKKDIEERLTYYENLKIEDYKIIVAGEHLRREQEQIYDDGVYYVRNEKDTKSIHAYTVKFGLYWLTYSVNNTEQYDPIFKELAKQHYKTVFMRINVPEFERLNGEKLMVENQPSIIFQKHGILTEEFVLTEKNKIEERLNFYENLTKEVFQEVVKNEVRSKQQQVDGDKH